MKLTIFIFLNIILRQNAWSVNEHHVSSKNNIGLPMMGKNPLMQAGGATPLEITTIRKMVATDSTKTLDFIFKPRCHADEGLFAMWPETEAGAWATVLYSYDQIEVCIKENYTPVRRYCSEKAIWEEPDAKRCAPVTLHNITKALIDLLGKESTEAINTLVQLTAEDQKCFQPIDIYLISEILDEASKDNEITENPDNFTGVLSNLMDFERETLNVAQQLLNSTDNILYSFDKLLLKTRNTNITQSKLFVRAIRVANNVVGAMIKSKNNTSFDDFQFFPLNNANQLQDEDFEIAFIVPQNFAKDHYYISLFYNDYLFNQNETVTLGSWILSILIPETRNDSDSTIQIYFKEFNQYVNQLLCNHWKYGNDENLIARPGEWKFDTVATKFAKEYYICEVDHTTHFGMLVSGTVPENFILDLITIFGSILSIIGIIVILLTAILFKKWRNEMSRKIVINVSICLLLLIILFIISDRVNNGAGCITVGILLHYMVIAQFCWSLAVSYSSYRRYYMVFNNVAHILKFCVFSWGVPLIIVVITAIINIKTYDKSPDEESSQICYPKGIYLKLGVCLPMAIILTINLIIYLFIIKNLTVTTLNIRKHVTKKSYNKQKVLVLLFFMMGMSWIFGVLVAFTDNIIFLYIFCTTATLHGFVIFIFYIVDSTEIKQQWKVAINKIIPKKLSARLSSKSQITDIVSESVVG